MWHWMRTQCCSNSIVAADSCWQDMRGMPLDKLHHSQYLISFPFGRSREGICWLLAACKWLSKTKRACPGVFVYGYCFYYYYARSDMSGFMQTSESSRLMHPVCSSAYHLIVCVSLRHLTFHMPCMGSMSSCQVATARR